MRSIFVVLLGIGLSVSSPTLAEDFPLDEELSKSAATTAPNVAWVWACWIYSFEKASS